MLENNVLSYFTHLNWQAGGYPISQRLQIPAQRVTQSHRVSAASAIMTIKV